MATMFALIVIGEYKYRRNRTTIFPDRVTLGRRVGESNSGQGEIFRTSSELPEAHPASHIRRAGCWALTTTPSSAEVEERVELYFTPFLDFHGLV